MGVAPYFGAALKPPMYVSISFAWAPLVGHAFKTIPVGVQQFFGQHTTDWGVVGAALVMATFPTLLIYVFLSRKIQESFMAGAIKG